MYNVLIRLNGKIYDMFKAEYIKGNIYPDGTNILELGLSGATLKFQLDLKLFSFEIEEEIN